MMRDGALFVVVLALSGVCALAAVYAILVLTGAI